VWLVSSKPVESNKESHKLARQLRQVYGKGGQDWIRPFESLKLLRLGAFGERARIATAQENVLGKATTFVHKDTIRYHPNQDLQISEMSNCTRTLQGN